MATAVGEEWLAQAAHRQAKSHILKLLLHLATLQGCRSEEGRGL